MALLSRLSIAPMLLATCFVPALVSCADNEENGKVLDAVVFTTDALLDAIDAPESTWVTQVDPGQTVNGELTNEAGGTLTAFGWRNTAQYDNESGSHVGYIEKLFIDLAQWNENGMNMSGKLVMTRHYMDFGPPGGSLDDVSRTTRYLATISVDGDVKGSFDVDVHAHAAGGTLWTCGAINGTGVEHGLCFEAQGE